MTDPELASTWQERLEAAKTQVLRTPILAATGEVIHEPWGSGGAMVVVGMDGKVASVLEQATPGLEGEMPLTRFALTKILHTKILEQTGFGGGLLNPTNLAYLQSLGLKHLVNLFCGAPARPFWENGNGFYVGLSGVESSGSYRASLVSMNARDSVGADGRPGIQLPVDSNLGRFETAFGLLIKDALRSPAAGQGPIAAVEEPLCLAELRTGL